MQPCLKVYGKEQNFFINSGVKYALKLSFKAKHHILLKLSYRLFLRPHGVNN